MERSVWTRSWCVGLLCAALASSACGSDEGDKEKGKDDAGTSSDGDGDASSGAGDDLDFEVPSDDGSEPTGEFTWFMLCGDPFCREGAGHTPHPGVEVCGDRKEGDPCSLEGDVCDPIDPCNANMKCAKTDPKPADGCMVY